MKNISKVFLVICPLLFLISGCENDDSGPYNLTDNQWRLASISTESEWIDILENSYFMPSSYILMFANETKFNLNTSVNTAAGDYTFNNDEIEFSNYQELSEVATNDSEQLRINKYLLDHLERVRRFEISQDKLILYLESEKLLFERVGS